MRPAFSGQPIGVTLKLRVALELQMYVQRKNHLEPEWSKCDHELMVGVSVRQVWYSNMKAPSFQVDVDLNEGDTIEVRVRSFAQQWNDTTYRLTSCSLVVPLVVPLVGNGRPSFLQ